MNRTTLSGLILVAAILPLFVIPSLNDIYVFPKIALFSSLLAVLVFLWALRIRVLPRVSFFSSPPFWPILLLLGTNLLSLTRAVNAYEGVFHVLWLFTCAMLFFLVVNNLNFDSLQKIIYWSIAAAVIVSVIGIGQFWGWKISFLPFRLGSTLGTKNMSAQSVILILPLAFIGFFSVKETKKELFYGLCAALMAIFVIYSKSRGSWVALIGAFVLLLIVSRKVDRLRDFGRFWQLTRGKKTILSLCAGLVMVVGVAAPYILPVPEEAESEDLVERFQSIFGTGHLSAQSRLAMAGNTLEMVKDHYLMGVGPGNWKFIYPLYSRSHVIDPIFTEKVQPNDAHNDWVQIPAEIGLGFIVFLWLIFTAYKMGWKALASSLKDPSGLARYRALTLLFLLFSISALMIDAFFDFPFKHPVPLFYFWMFLGSLQILAQPGLNTTGSLERTPPLAKKTPPNVIARERSDRGNLAASWKGMRLPRSPAEAGSLAMTDRDFTKGGLERGGKPNRLLSYFLVLSTFFIIVFAAWNITYLRSSYHFRQGMDFLKTGRLFEAISHMERAASLAPFEYRYHTALSVLYSRTKQYDKAALAARVALLYHPNYINAWNNLGVAFGKAGLSRDAEKPFQKALHIYPDYYQGHVNLGNNYKLMGQMEKARKEYQEALRIKPGAEEILKKLRALDG